MPDEARRDGPTAARLLVAMGLIVSGGLLAVVGGWSGRAIGAGQIALGVALLWLHSVAPLAGAVLLLVPAPLAAIRHWSGRLPLMCRCARLAHPSGLVSVTGLAVAVDLLVLGLALWLVGATRQAKVENSSP